MLGVGWCVGYELVLSKKVCSIPKQLVRANHIELRPHSYTQTKVYSLLFTTGGLLSFRENKKKIQRKNTYKQTKTVSQTKPFE